MNTLLNNNPTQTHTLQDSSLTTSVKGQKIYRFSKAPMTQFQKANALRMLQADAFALSNRGIMNLFLDTNYTYQEQADAMNRLGMRSHDGAYWTAQSTRKLRIRLNNITELALIIEAANQVDGAVGTKEEVLEDLSIDLFSFLIEGEGRPFNGTLFCNFPDLT